MRSFIWAVGALVVGISAARATTYQLSYTGKQLTQAYPDLPIKGAKHLVFVIQSATPFPKNTCFHVPFASVTYFSDGKDTLATLAAAGYSYTNYGMLLLCSDVTGRHISSWSGGYGFQKDSGNPEKPDYFGASTYSTPPTQTKYYDIALLQIAKKRGGADGYKEHDEQSTMSPGAWKWKMLDQ